MQTHSFNSSVNNATCKNNYIKGSQLMIEEFRQWTKWLSWSNNVTCGDLDINETRQCIFDNVQTIITLVEQCTNK